MIKKFFLPAYLFLLCLTFSSCGGKDGDQGKKDSTITNIVADALTHGDDADSGNINQVACIPPDSSIINMTWFKQRTAEWCWAACMQMCMVYYGRQYYVDQCEIRNNKYNVSVASGERMMTGINCCDYPTPTQCVEGGMPDFKCYGFKSKTATFRLLDWNGIRNEIGCTKRPFCGVWEWTGGGSHMVVVCGYSSGQTQVKIYDPLQDDPYYTDYNIFRNKDGVYTNTMDLYSIEPDPGVTNPQCKHGNNTPVPEPQTIMRFPTVFFKLPGIYFDSVNTDTINKGFFYKYTKLELYSFLKLIKPENFMEFGFKAPPINDSIKLGTPMREYIIRKDSLAKHNKSISYTGLFIPLNYYFVPVINNSYYAFGMDVRALNNNYKPVSFGGANFTKKLGIALNNILTAYTFIDPKSIFRVDIPSMNLYFLGFYLSNELYLLPVIENLKNRLVTSTFYKANDLLPVLADSLKLYDDLPR
jgi:hypothetical protein